MQLSKVIGNYKIKNVDYSYNKDNKYINNFSADLNSSEISVVSGANGSGKTTIAKLITGLLTPESGDILLMKPIWRNSHYYGIRVKLLIFPKMLISTNSSILNNILISNPDLNEQEVSRLLQNVGLDKDLKNQI